MINKVSSSPNGLKLQDAKMFLKILSFLWDNVREVVTTDENRSVFLSMVQYGTLCSFEEGETKEGAKEKYKKLKNIVRRMEEDFNSDDEKKSVSFTITKLKEFACYSCHVQGSKGSIREMTKLYGDGKLSALSSEVEVMLNSIDWGCDKLGESDAISPLKEDVVEKAILSFSSAGESFGVGDLNKRGEKRIAEKDLESEDGESFESCRTRRKQKARKYERFYPQEDNYLFTLLKKMGWGSWARIASVWPEGRNVRAPSSLKDRARTKRWDPDDFPVPDIIDEAGIRGLGNSRRNNRANSNDNRKAASRDKHAFNIFSDSDDDE